MDNSAESDLNKAVTWQFDNAAKLTALVDAMKDAYKKSAQDFFDSMPDRIGTAADVSDVDEKYSLATWGRLLGVPRIKLGTMYSCPPLISMIEYKSGWILDEAKAHARRSWSDILDDSELPQSCFANRYPIANYYDYSKNFCPGWLVYLRKAYKSRSLEGIYITFLFFSEYKNADLIRYSEEKLEQTDLTYPETFIVRLIRLYIKVCKDVTFTKHQLDGQISDSLYRKILKAKAKLIRSSGTIPDYIAYFNDIFGEYVIIKDNGNMCLSFTMKDDFPYGTELDYLFASRDPSVFLYPCGVNEPILKYGRKMCFTELTGDDVHCYWSSNFATYNDGDYGVPETIFSIGCLGDSTFAWED